VPLTGFLNPSAVSADRIFAALFRAATVPGISLQRFPLAESAHPSRGHCSPAVIHPPAKTRRLRLITDRFTDSHARAQLPGSPADYELPFRLPRRADLLVTLGLAGEPALFSELHLLRSFLPPASPFSTDASCPTAAADTLLGSSSPEPSPTTPRSLNPPKHPKALQHDRSARRPRPLTKGPPRLESLVNPSAQVGIPVEPKHPRVPVGGCWPCGDQPGPPLGGLFSSHDLLSYEQARRPWPTEYSSASRAAFPPERGANSPEVSASSTAS